MARLLSLVCGVVALVACDGCKQAGPMGPGPGGSDQAQRARALLARDATLPVRAEVVAIADAVAIESSRHGRTAEGAALARLAADLRVRLWRLDGAAADAREALELYAAASNAAPATLDACEADRARATVAAETARDAVQAFRELYVVRHRHAAVEPAAPCVASLDRSLAMLAAYKPPAETLRALERDAAKSGAGVQPVKVSVPGASSMPAAPGAPTGVPRDLVVSPADDATTRGPVKITGVERHVSEQGGRVVVQLSGPTTFAVGNLPADDAAKKDARVFVDVARASAKGVPKEIEVGGVVRRVRLGPRDGGTRVVLDLAAMPFRRVFYLPDPFRIVIDVSTRPPVSVDAQGSGKREIRRIVIDPGHGGIDHGAVGPTGLKEKDVALDIAHRVAPVLARELKIETMLTRDGDTFVPLDLRTARANAFHADLFVSIHCNASEDGHARGVQTFYLDEARSHELAELRVVARENASRGQALDPKSLDAALSPILSGLGVGQSSASSRHLADLVQRAALASLNPRYPDVRDQGVKSAGFFVLAGADMPAVLFETSFISNPDDEGRLATADYRQKMADAIVNAVRAFRDGH